MLKTGVDGWGDGGPYQRHNPTGERGPVRRGERIFQGDRQGHHRNGCQADNRSPRLCVKFGLGGQRPVHTRRRPGREDAPDQVLPRLPGITLLLKLLAYFNEHEVVCLKSFNCLNISMKKCTKIRIFLMFISLLSIRLVGFKINT